MASVLHSGRLSDVVVQHITGKGKGKGKARGGRIVIPMVLQDG
jgi:hypothetical protein